MCLCANECIINDTNEHTLAAIHIFILKREYTHTRTLSCCSNLQYKAIRKDDQQSERERERVNWGGGGGGGKGKVHKLFSLIC